LEPTTTTTTTEEPFACVEVTNATFSGGTSECDGTTYPITLGNVTAELVDNLGNPVIATNDIVITLAFESKQCGDTIPIPYTIPITILTGTSLISYGYTEQIVNDCGVNDCQTLTEFFQSVVSVFPEKYSLCSGITTTTTTTIAPTTTTTTTVCPCVEYVSIGMTEAGTFNYLDCFGTPKSVFLNEGPNLFVGLGEPECVDRNSLSSSVSFEVISYGPCCIPTTTTTTTIAPTTTTTTTPLGECLEFEYDGGIDGGSFVYTNCILDPEDTFFVPPNETGSLCAISAGTATGTVTLTLIGNCPPA
jgi:hypothetical protein